MPSLANLFATTVCRAELGRGHARLHAEIDAECRAIAAGDKAENEKHVSRTKAADHLAP